MADFTGAKIFLEGGPEMACPGIAGKNGGARLTHRWSDMGVVHTAPWGHPQKSPGAATTGARV